MGMRCAANSNMNGIDPTTTIFWQEVALAIVCGAIVGIEREARGRPTGVRTSILVCLGTSLYVRLGVELAGESGDHSRVLGQVITGIGFIGAGSIMAKGDSVTGVTTASVVWIMAAVGALIGTRHFAEQLSNVVF